MSELYFSRRLDDARTLYVAPLSDRRIEASGQDVPDPSGYFLFKLVGLKILEKLRLSRKWCRKKRRGGSVICWEWYNTPEA